MCFCLPFEISPGARAVPADAVEMWLTPGIPALSSRSLAVVLLDMAEETIFFLEGMTGGPVIVIFLIVVTVAAPDTAEVKRDGDTLALVHAPEQEVFRCV